jgi:hypothetical protein
MKTTPLHLELLIHYYSTCSRHPRAGSPASVRFTQELQDAGLIRPCETDSGFKTTSTGTAHILALCAMPITR